MKRPIKFDPNSDEHLIYTLQAAYRYAIGDLSIGTWDEGITLASTQCITTQFLYFAKFDLFYLGTPGDIMILDHPDWPGWVIDCHEPYGEVDYYCVWMHGGVCKDALEGDEECYPVVPVEAVTWGSIKSMYR